MPYFVQFVVLVALSSGAVGTVHAEERIHHTFRYLTDAGYPQTFKTLTFSPDSSQLAVSVAGRVDFIDPNLGRITGQYKATPFSLAYSRDGDRIYMISQYRRTLLDTLTGSRIETKRVVAPGYLGFRLAKQSGKLEITHLWDGGPVAAIDGIQVGDELVGIGDGRNGNMRDVAGRSVTEALELLAGPAGTYVQLRILPRGKFGKHNVRTHVVRRQPGEFVNNELRFTEQSLPETGENLVWCMSDDRHELSNAMTGLPIAQLRTINIANVGQYAVSPDQKKFAVVARRNSDSSKNAVEVFDIATLDRLAFMPVPEDGYSDIAFAADNNRVLVATSKSLQIADTAEERFTDSIAKKRSQRILAVSSQDIVATGDSSGRVALWDLETGRTMGLIPTDSEEEIKAIAFSPNGEWLAFHTDGVLHVVDVSDKKSTAQTKSPPNEQKNELADSDGPHSEAVPITADKQSKRESPFVLKVGARIELYSRGKWHPAVIVRDDGDGRWQAHYDDSPDDWDELVTERRIRTRGEQ